jgi:hypothetical protein
MKLRNVYLTIFLLALINLIALSVNVAPDAKVINLFGYNVGVNFTHYWWLKLIGFISIVLYYFDPSFKSKTSSESK